MALPADLPARIVRISGDTCTASLIQNSELLVDSTTGHPCQVTVELEQGSMLSTIVTFRGVGGCCTNGYQVTDSSSFEYEDGGAAY